MSFRNNAMSFLSGMFNGLAIVGGLGSAGFMMAQGFGPVEAAVAGGSVALGCLYGTYRAAKGPRALNEFNVKASGAGIVASIAAVTMSAIPFLA